MSIPPRSTTQGQNSTSRRALPGGPAAGAAGARHGCGAFRADDIERRRRGQPENALAALAAVVPVLTTAKAEERLQALVVRGWLQSKVPDEAEIEAAAQNWTTCRPA